MKNALIIHGTLATPESNWFPWIKKELEKLDYQVALPQFPTPKGQTIPNYLKIMDQEVKKLGGYNQETILIGHSSGPLAITAKLSELTSPVHVAFLVAPFLGDLGNHEYDAYNKDFNEYNYDWDKAKKGAQEIVVFRSPTDPYVPSDNASAFAKCLNAKEIVIKDAGHFNQETGFTTFPQLVEEINKL